MSTQKKTQNKKSKNIKEFLLSDDFDGSSPFIKILKVRNDYVKVYDIWINSVKVSDRYYKNVMDYVMAAIIKNRLRKDPISNVITVYVNVYENIYSYRLSFSMYINENDDSYLVKLYDGLYAFEDTLLEILDLIEHLNGLPEDARVSEVINIFMKEVLSPEEVEPLDLKAFMQDLFKKGSRLDKKKVSRLMKLRKKDSDLRVYNLLKARLKLDRVDEDRLLKYVLYM